jgi:hypothetical protein
MYRPFRLHSASVAGGDLYMLALALAFYSAANPDRKALSATAMENQRCNENFT